jgi:hypothetical protein
VTGVVPALAALVAAFAPPAALVANALPGRAAQPAALTLRATFELQCGRVGQMTVGLPAAMGVRTSTVPGAVLVNGAHPASVRASGHVVQVTMPPPQGVICDSIGPARITVRFTKGAGLVNPQRAGSYAVSLRLRGTTAAGRLKITH